MVKQGVLGPEATNGNISGKALRKTVLEARVIRCRNRLPQQRVRALSEVVRDGVSKNLGGDADVTQVKKRGQTR